MPYLIARIRAAGCSILAKWSSLARETMPIGEADPRRERMQAVVRAPAPRIFPGKRCGGVKPGAGRTIVIPDGF